MTILRAMQSIARRSLRVSGMSLRPCSRTMNFGTSLQTVKARIPPTRIDFLLGMMTEIHSDMFEQKEISRENLDSRDGLFRAYYSVFRKNREQFKRIWGLAQSTLWILCVFGTRMSTCIILWGFRVIDRESIPNLIKAWNGKVVSDFMTN